MIVEINKRKKKYRNIAKMHAERTSSTTLSPLTEDIMDPRKNKENDANIPVVSKRPITGSENGIKRA